MLRSVLALRRWVGPRNGRQEHDKGKEPFSSGGQFYHFVEELFQESHKTGCICVSLNTDSLDFSGNNKWGRELLRWNCFSEGSLFLGVFLYLKSKLPDQNPMHVRWAAYALCWQLPEVACPSPVRRAEQQCQVRHFLEMVQKLRLRHRGAGSPHLLLGGTGTSSVCSQSLLDHVHWKAQLPGRHRVYLC